LDFEAIGLNVVQPEQLILARKYTVGALADHFYVCVVASGQREPAGQLQPKSGGPEGTQILTQLSELRKGQAPSPCPKVQQRGQRQENMTVKEPRRAPRHLTLVE